MKPRKIYRIGPPCPIDQMFFDRLADAGCIGLSPEHCGTLRALIEDAKTLPTRQADYRQERGIKRTRGRQRSIGLHSLVCGALWVFEDAGGTVAGSKPKSNPSHVSGRAAAFLMVFWDALDDPGVARDGFARLVCEAWRNPRTSARNAREAYLQHTLAAWRR